MTYRLTTSDIILRLSDNAYIPPDPQNADYIDFLVWCKEGNEPEPMPVPEVTWDDIRIKRDGLITASDWTMTPGATVDQHAWAVYRQVLRDLPQTYKDQKPADIVWPEQPSSSGPNQRIAEAAAAEEAAKAAAQVTEEETVSNDTKPAATSASPEAAPAVSSSAVLGDEPVVTEAVADATIDPSSKKTSKKS